ncbi:hypothetical protein C5E45_20055 [Nocardia nova]|uniref:Uncharacterized protein n=1 Tax=Nocardia nova TaxID=37330 RepID=A0A2S6AMA0_9NOCA|nr:hypothetical protein [Nocardia nova]PPJ36350.1 hypothetical protein C5E45_20055 [Nocardia nova]
MLLGAVPDGLTLTKRPIATLDDQRQLRVDHVAPDEFVIARDDRNDWRWWTWAGTEVNRTISAWAIDIVAVRQRIDGEPLRLHSDLSIADIRSGPAPLRSTGSRPVPAADSNALRGLKFSAALPESLARVTLAARTSVS